MTVAYWLLVAAMGGLSCATAHDVELPSIGQAPYGSTFSKQNGEYIFAPEDIVEVYVHREPKYSGRFTVGKSGYIIIPNLGPVYAKNRNVSLLQTAVQIKLRPFVKYPRVTVAPAYSYSYQVVFSGSVRKPGRYTFSKKTTLVEGLAVAGALHSKKTSIVLIRQDEHGTKQRYQIELDNIKERQSAIDNFVLERGDIVVVN